MNIFFKKIIFFLSPLFLLGLMVAVLDPFGMWRGQEENLNPHDLIAYQLNAPLWKSIAFAQHTCDKILLGDSRMEALTDSQMLAITGEKWFNFAFCGASLQEMSKSFWFATQKTALQEVVFGINLGRYNGRQILDRCTEAHALFDHPHLYLINRSVLKGSYYRLREIVRGEPIHLARPTVDRASFWQHQLDYLARTLYQEYSYPEAGFAELERIAAYCKQHNIQLRFVILPTHADLQQRLTDFGREADLDRMRTDLAKLGPVYDFHQKDSLTLEAHLYKDPFHFKPEVGEKLIETVFRTK
ncbi:MAG: hypothetical protein AAF206_17745 [Bacteroidota bacterium]